MNLYTVHWTKDKDKGIKIIAASNRLYAAYQMLDILRDVYKVWQLQNCTIQIDKGDHLFVSDD